MPRMKTKAAAKKRFTFTETTQKRNLDHTALVSRDDEARVKRMLLA